jgi:hypothetical protein
MRPTERDFHAKQKTNKGARQFMKRAGQVMPGAPTSLFSFFCLYRHGSCKMKFETWKNLLQSAQAKYF